MKPWEEIGGGQVVQGDKEMEYMLGEMGRRC